MIALWAPLSSHQRALVASLFTEDLSDYDSEDLLRILGHLRVDWLADFFKRVLPEYETMTGFEKFMLYMGGSLGMPE